MGLISVPLRIIKWAHLELAKSSGEIANKHTGIALRVKFSEKVLHKGQNRATGFKGSEETNRELKKKILFIKQDQSNMKKELENQEIIIRAIAKI